LSPVVPLLWPVAKTTGDPYVPAGSRFAGGAGGPIVKVGAQDFTLDPGPFRATGVQFGGSMPGGHGSASFTVPVANAYLAPYHALREGEWVVIYDDAHELYEGEILSIKPSVDSSGQHKLSVVCGGIGALADKRDDVSATWIHRGSDGWIRRPGTPSNLGNVTLDDGAIDLRVSLGSTQDYSAAALTSSIWAVFVLDQGLSDDEISYVDLAGAYDVAVESTFAWTWALYTAPALGGTYKITALTDASAVDGAYSAQLTPPAGTKVLGLRLHCASGAHTTAAEKYLTLTTCDVYGQSRTTKPRIDEAMVALATRPGLATSSYSENVGPQYDDLRVGNDKAMVTAAGGMNTLAALHAKPFEWAFWDDKKFWCRPIPSVPNDAQIIVVGGGNPGLESWDVAENDEDVPEYACVLYGNLDDDTLPEGWPRKLYRPTTPEDDGDLRIERVDYSSLILSDAAAAALGSNIVGAASGSTIPAGYIFDALPSKAKEGTHPGNNVDPTSSYYETYAGALGTLTNFDYVETSGWSGSGVAVDPYVLVNDDDGYVDFGDLSVADFGTTPFSVRAWITVPVAPSVDFTPIIGKVASGVGWKLGITNAMTVSAVVADSASDYRQQTGDTVLEVGMRYHVAMTYAGSGGDIKLYVNGVAEGLTSAGALGAWDVSNAGDLQLMKVH
jgi:hypothetical protein